MIVSFRNTAQSYHWHKPLCYFNQKKFIQYKAVFLLKSFTEGGGIKVYL